VTSFFHRIFRRFFGASLGLGHPVPAAAFDAEFRSGHWALLHSAAEEPRYAAIAALVRTHGCRRPVLLDAGCGSGQLLTCFAPGDLGAYHGVDLSTEAIRHARVSALADSVFQEGDLETWTTDMRYDVIVINEVMGYFRDPRATVLRLATFLEPGGILIVSLYRWGNASAIWKRLISHLPSVRHEIVTNRTNGKTWDIHLFKPLAQP